MKKKYVAYAALLAMSLLLFTGCDALISNAFKSANLGQPSAEKIKEMKTDDLIEAAGLSSGEVSDTFIETVLSDADTLQAVKNTLQDTIDNGEPEEAQQANVLLLNIELAEDDIDEVVDNINKSIGNIFSQLGGESKSSKAAKDINYLALIEEMFPSKDIVAPVVNALYDLHPAIVNFADLLKNSPEIYLDHSVVAYFAQIAILSEAIYQVQTNYLNTTNFATTGDAAADIYQKLVIDKVDPATLNKSDYLSTDPDMAAVLAGSVNNQTTLYVLFKAAGMEDILTMLQDAVKDK